MRSGLLIVFLRGKEKNISQENYVWNTIAGGVNAAEAVVLMMIITRTNGVEAAGILSIAFAVGNLLMTVGKFGVRNYQVTDIKKQFSFNSYFTLRIISVVIMVLVSAGYAAINLFQQKYSCEKAVVVLAICLIYAIEAFEDVFLGLYQKEGRLDIASKIFVIRWIAIMVTFLAIAIITNNLLLSIGSSLAISLVMEIWLIRDSIVFFQKKQLKVDTVMLMELIKQCSALFLVTFLTYYVTNAPKYAIDQYLTEDIQAYYGYISMPVFVVELLNCFLYQPQMVRLAENWNGGNYKAYNKSILRQYMIILGLTVLCAAGAYLVGIPLLSFIYGVELGKYKVELVVLMISGGALAYVGYSSVLLTIMRKQKMLLYNMLFASILALAGFEKAVRLAGMMGAAKYYLMLMCVLAIVNSVCIKHVEYKCKKCMIEMENNYEENISNRS